MPAKGKAKPIAMLAELEWAAGAEPLENPKHEEYARLRGIKHLTSVEAYATVYGKIKNLAYNAERLSRRPEIKLRMAFLVQAVLEAQSDSEIVSREKLLQELIRNLSLARTAEQIAAANKAIELYGSEVHGMFAKKSVVVTGEINELEGQSITDLQKLIHAICEEQGIEYDQAYAFFHEALSRGRAQLSSGDGEESPGVAPSEAEVLPAEPQAT